jgi:hypothetical protein
MGADCFSLLFLESSRRFCSFFSKQKEGIMGAASVVLYGFLRIKQR